MKFKAMKFFIGQEPNKELCFTILKGLSDLGYLLKEGCIPQLDRATGITTDTAGVVSAYLYFKEASLTFSDLPYEEVNIDWMRKEARSKVEIDGKFYYEDDYEEALAWALSKITEVEE